MELRRVVTGVNSDGKSCFVSDGPPPHAHDFVELPGHCSALVWMTDGGESTPNTGVDITPGVQSVVPGPGQTRFQIVTLPPSGVGATPGFDAEKALAEQQEWSPGLFDHFENPGASAFHATPSIDYCVLLDGELVLQLDEGERAIHAGDIVIQNGTRHAWQNRTDQVATVLCVLVGVSK
ncbi:cupin domain-containing protein [Kribbella sandramycini]|uniref:Cupin domain-containing protein n=1 Tax=Kribbella sandramycini TaxID=60450 RepID=A0A7Y4KXV9_9ACTN|nr:cupin domain-containing protein [Kribbella sandramycini]MBB6567727.1 hypothetical protein [Kribbella sandramycini]NOL39676.1 cupin domain-containing protein [Kribbella sandramycini]